MDIIFLSFFRERDQFYIVILPVTCSLSNFGQATHSERIQINQPTRCINLSDILYVV